MKRKIWCFLLILFLIPGRAVAVQEGSLQLTLRCNGCEVSGGSFLLYDAAGLDADADPEQLARYARAHLTPLAEMHVDERGKAACSGLAPGQYLVVQSENAEGYLPIKPFLFSVPIRIGGDTVYQIEAAPKLSPEPDALLPQTGQLQWPVWVLGGLGIVLLGAGLLIRKKE